MVKLRTLVVGVASLAIAAGPACAGLEELARAGRWQQVLDMGQLRTHQLPLRPEESLIAAEAARIIGNPVLLQAFLEQAVGGNDIHEVAAVELAALLVEREPARAVALVLPLMRSAATAQLRAAAVEVAEDALQRGLPATSRQDLDAAASRLPSALHRRVETALAVTHPDPSVSRLARILDQSIDDLAALDAAQALQRLGGLSPQLRFRVAETLFRHALYPQAGALLEQVAAAPPREAPAWRIAFLRGRCAFRMDQWEDAARWYRRAIAAADTPDRTANLEVHLARTLELAGDADAAAQLAVRALGHRATDERRLFAARLLLRVGDDAAARRALAAVAGREPADRGRLLLALDALRDGAPERAANLLRQVRSAGWRQRAQVVAARLEQQARHPERALDLLREAAAGGLDEFWGRAARRVMDDLPAGDVRRWRAEQRAALDGAAGPTARRVMARWAVLEPDPAVAAELQARLAGAVEPPPVPPAFPTGLAGTLWRLGLVRSGAAWDPGGYPTAPGPAALWSAQRLLEAGATRRAVRHAESVHKGLGGDLPQWALPEVLQRLLYPLPDGLSGTVHGSAAAADLPWQLLAGVVREESRWDETALSVVGARGLTQLMPTTAAAVAARLGRQPPPPESLFLPEVALQLGGAELGRLLDVFDGRWAPVAAAYNAGEAQAKIWLDEVGDGYSDEVYALTVTFSATRGYVAHVLGSAWAYEELYPEADQLPAG